MIKNLGGMACPDLFEEELCDLSRCCAYTNWGNWEACVNVCGDVEGAVFMKHRMVTSIWIEDQCSKNLMEVKFDKELQPECPFKCPVGDFLLLS